MVQKIVQVDAFTDRPFAGNPAAVCILERPRVDAWMRNVAREMNLSETAFLLPFDAPPDYRLRWFTPATEVDLCGHATLASAYVLWEEGHLPPDQTARFHTRSGLLTATLDGVWITLDFPAKPPQAVPDAPPGLVEALGLPAVGASVLYVGFDGSDYIVEIGAGDPEGAVRLRRDGTTLLRPDGTATYQLASVADDLDLRITHVIRGNDHRPNLEIQQRIARAIGGELPEVIHHGLVLGEDGKKLSKRHGHSSIAELREEGFPPEAVRAYLDELDLPEHDVHLDLARLRRLAIDAIAAMSDEQLAAAAQAPVEAVPVLRGARSLVEAREYARLLLEPFPAQLPAEARPTLDRFAELRSPASEWLSTDEARGVLRELKAVGGDLRSLRLALTGATTGPELAAVVSALPREEALRRVARAVGA